jgi:hypothetical protein
MVYDEHGPPTSISRQSAGWGMVAFSVGAVALVLEARRDPRFRNAAAAFVVSALGVLPMVLPDYWFGRFVLFFPAIMSIAAASLAAQARPAALAAAAGAALQFIATLVPRDLPAPAMAALASMSWREKSVARLQKVRPEGDAVAVFAMLRSRIYPLYGPDFSRRVVYLRPASVRDLPGMMKREGASVIVLALPARVMADVRAMEREGIWRDLGENAFELAR